MRQYLAAVAGLFAALGVASAQAPAAPTTTTIQPVGAYTAAGNYADPVVASGPGCSACGPVARHGVLARAAYGPGTVMPIGCSCLAAERTFFFGSCGQFFNPTQYCGSGGYGAGCNGGGYGGGGCNTCGGGARERHPCAGVTSYLNR